MSPPKAKSPENIEKTKECLVILNFLKDELGSRSMVAKRLGISKATVNRWFKTGVIRECYLNLIPYLNSDEKLIEDGTIANLKFSEADSNGSTILDGLIKKSILEEVSSTEVRLKRNNCEPISRPSEMQGSDFDEIWGILQPSNELTINETFEILNEWYIRFKSWGKISIKIGVNKRTIKRWRAKRKIGKEYLKLIYYKAQR